LVPDEIRHLYCAKNVQGSAWKYPSFFALFRTFEMKYLFAIAILLFNQSFATPTSNSASTTTNEYFPTPTVEATQVVQEITSRENLLESYPRGEGLQMPVLARGGSGVPFLEGILAESSRITGLTEEELAAGRRPRRFSTRVLGRFNMPDNSGPSKH
jgi:hypothetical protein